MWFNQQKCLKLCLLIHLHGKWWKFWQNWYNLASSVCWNFILYLVFLTLDLSVNEDLLVNKFKPGIYDEFISWWPVDITEKLLTCVRLKIHKKCWENRFFFQAIKCCLVLDCSIIFTVFVFHFIYYSSVFYLLVILCSSPMNHENKKKQRLT